jgi:hypothetical protein
LGTQSITRRESQAQAHVRRIEPGLQISKGDHRKKVLLTGKNKLYKGVYVMQLFYGVSPSNKTNFTVR